MSGVQIMNGANYERTSVRNESDAQVDNDDLRIQERSSMRTNAVYRKVRLRPPGSLTVAPSRSDSDVSRKKQAVVRPDDNQTLESGLTMERKLNEKRHGFIDFGQCPSRLTASCSFLNECSNDENYSAAKTESMHSFPESADEWCKGGKDDDFSDDGFSENDDCIYENPAELVIELQTREKTRRQVANELLKCEINYLEKLDFMCKVRHQLLSVNTMNDTVPCDEVIAMFPNVEELRDLHHDSIVPALQESLRDWNDQSIIGTVFFENIPKLKLYGSYIKAAPRAFKAVEVWSLKEPKFVKLVRLFEQAPECNQLQLIDLMQEPYIKLQRWKLLLQRYQKYLTETNTDFVVIPVVLSAIEQVLQECQQELKLASALGNLLELDNRIDGLIVFLNCDTELVKEGPVTQIDPRGRKIGMRAFIQRETPLYLFLFNRFILVCTPKRTNKKHTVCHKIHTSSLKIIPGTCVASMGYQPSRCFILQSTKKAIVLMFQSDEEMDSWQKVILKVSQTTRKPSALTIQNSVDASCENFTCAPVWLPDESSSCCMHCCQDFSLINRRHHCRGCGILVCSHCTSKMKLPYKELKSCLVCQPCFIRAKRFFPLLVDESGHNPCDDSGSCDLNSWQRENSENGLVPNIKLSPHASFRLRSEEV